MLKLNHSRLRRAVGLAAALGVAFAGAFAASAAQEAAPETKKFVKKIEVHADSKDVLRSGGPGEHGRMMNCPGEKFEASHGSDASNQQEEVKFFVCAAKGESLLPALEKAAADIEAVNDMPAAGKGEILQKIRAKIAELRARG